MERKEDHLPPTRGIRLSAHDQMALKKVFRLHFSEPDELWIFGSRTNLDKKGGDIDLYIETHENNVSNAVKKRASFWSDLQDEIGEQKIDIVLNLVSLGGEDLPIYTVAKKEGIRML